MLEARRQTVAKQVIWTKQIIDEFAELALLNEDEIEILKMRAEGKTIVQQSMKIGLSEAAINSITARLKLKYDMVQPNSKYMPKRKLTVKETYKKGN